MAWCECPVLEKDGYRYNQFFGSALAECVYTPADYIPSILGLISVLSWMLSGLPQYWTNYRNKKAEALSPTFILIRFSGDMAFCISNVMLHLPTTVQVQGVYFMLDNAIMLSQLAYYTYLYPRLQKGANRPPTVASTSMCAVALVAAGALTSMMIMSPNLSTGARSLLASVPSRPGHCDYSPAMSSGIVWAGDILSWFSAIVYLASRMPQLYRNYQMKQCEGLSLSMFGMFALANLSFSLQTLLREEIYFRLVIGSFGPFLCDCVIIAQAKMYNKSNALLTKQ